VDQSLAAFITAGQLGDFSARMGITTARTGEAIDLTPDIGVDIARTGAIIGFDT
jgi:hypothetical protein